VRVRWFGEPWPSRESPAPICDDDAFRVETPVGKRCLHCPDLIVEGERGVVMATDPLGNEWWTMEIQQDGDEFRLPVVAAHIDCLMRATLGPEVESMVAHAAGVTRVPED
jgi:hypothetical protein